MKVGYTLSAMALNLVPYQLEALNGLNPFSLANASKNARQLAGFFQ